MRRGDEADTARVGPGGGGSGGGGEPGEYDYITDEDISDLFD